MRAPSPLPPNIRNTPFTVRAALSVGVSRSRLRRADLARPHRGVRIPAGIDSDIVERCRALAIILPHRAFFSHSTAALLLGIPLPSPLQRDDRMHVSVTHPMTPPAIRGVIPHEYRSAPQTLLAPSGLLLSSPATTWTMLAQILSVADLVAAGDYLVGGRSPLTTIAKLHSAVRARHGTRGVRRMREALPQIRVGVRSRRETHIRLIAVAAGFPEPELNTKLYDESGRFVAMVDIAWLTHRVAVEYEGKHHQETQQFRRDVARRERVEDIGWRLTRATSNDLTFGVVEFVTRLGRRLQHPVSSTGIARAVALSCTFG